MKCPLRRRFDSCLRVARTCRNCQYRCRTEDQKRLNSAHPLSQLKQAANSSISPSASSPPSRKIWMGAAAGMRSKAIGLTPTPTDPTTHQHRLASLTMRKRSCAGVCPQSDEGKKITIRPRPLPKSSGSPRLVQSRCSARLSACPLNAITTSMGGWIFAFTKSSADRRRSQPGLRRAAQAPRPAWRAGILADRQSAAPWRRGGNGGVCARLRSAPRPARAG